MSYDPTSTQASSVLFLLLLIDYLGFFLVVGGADILLSD